MLVTAIIVEICAIFAFLFVVRKTFFLPSPTSTSVGRSGLQQKIVLPLSHKIHLPAKSSPTLTKTLAYGAFLLTILLYASFALVAHDALGRLDAVLFTAMQMVMLVPCACFLLIKWRSLLTQAVFFRGLVLGGTLASALLLLTYSFKSAGIMETTIFMSLNGLVATGISVFIFRQRLSMYTRMACVCSLVGIVLIWLTAFQHWQGNFTAFVGGSLMTLSAFLVERLLIPVTLRQEKMLWPILGVQMVTMAIGASLLALCFGEWETLSALRLQDFPVMVYTSIGTILLPLILTAKAQRYVSAVTIAFLSILEPLFTCGFAVILGEHLSALASLGGLVILVGVVLQAVAGVRSDQAPSVGREALGDVDRVSVSEVSAPHGKPDLPVVYQQRQVKLGKRARSLIYLLASYPQGADLPTIQRRTHASRTVLHQELMLLRELGYVFLQDGRRYLLHPSLLPPRSVQQFSEPQVSQQPAEQIVAPVFYRAELPA